MGALLAHWENVRADDDDWHGGRVIHAWAGAFALPLLEQPSDQFFSVEEVAQFIQNTTVQKNACIPPEFIWRAKWILKLIHF